MSFTKESRAAFLDRLSALKIPYKQKTWHNYSKNVVQPRAVVINVDNEEQVRKTILAVNEVNEDHPDKKITIHATAGWQDQKCRTRCCGFWKKAQENHYNESFSFSNVAKADVIIRFNKAFHAVKVLEAIDEETHLVEVSAGMQIAELADRLRKAAPSLSLPTASMIPWVSFVGLAGTGGHGTGRDQPAVSGLLESAWVCDVNGNFVEMTRHDEDFPTLFGAHAGMLGVVLSVKLRAVKAFNLREDIYNFADVAAMRKQLNALLSNNQYFTLMRIPTYSFDKISDKSVNKWHIRCWNRTDAPPTQYDNAPYAADAGSLEQELSVRIGESVQGLLLSTELKHLYPIFSLLMARFITHERGTETRVDKENHIAHYQSNFPEDLHDVSFFVPVKDSKAAEVLGDISAKVDELLEKAGERDEYPLTYAMYVRYIKGTNGGLSGTATDSEDERILAIDMATHPAAPGIERFEKDFLAYLTDELGIQPRFHPGKELPPGVNNYYDFHDKAVLDQYKATLERWCGGKEALRGSAFVTPYMEKMLRLEPYQYVDTLSASEASPAFTSEAPLTPQRCCDCLTALIEEINKLCPVSEDETLEKLRDTFVDECRQKIDELARNEKVASVS